MNTYQKIKEKTGGKIYLGVGLKPGNQDEIAIEACYVEELIKYGYLDVELKKEFLDLWLSDDMYDDLDDLDPIELKTYHNLLKYADMEPHVDISPFLHKAA
ncbi:hypothetical protein ACP8NE_00930 [Corynebacterium ulcerans]|uniref:hypothetical protein n=1 Tax=Corynebacterium ulcerans TaxID=65058 RepID=UPI003D700CA1